MKALNWLSAHYADITFYSNMVLYIILGTGITLCLAKMTIMLINGSAWQTEDGTPCKRAEDKITPINADPDNHTTDAN